MELGNFLGKLKGKEKELPESFLALVLTNNLVQAAVWQVIEGKTEIISLGTPVEWDGEVATTNELVQAVDATISSATEGIESEPTKIIFGLANSWVDLKGILGSKKDLVKAICKDLELKALGYVVLSDCILKYLKMQEGTPTTTILVQASRRDVIVSLVKLGRTEGSVTVGGSGKIGDDVGEALSHFTQDDPLPSRFIVVSSMENTSELVQELTAYDWSEKFNFLHTPKIEALPKDIEVHATAVAGGTEVATSLGFVYTTSSEDSAPAPESSQSEESSDIALEPELLTAEDVGFSSGIPTPTEVKEDIEDIVEESEASSPRFRLPEVRLALPKIALPQFRLPHFRSSFYLLLIPVILLLVGLLSMLYFLPHAQLTLLLKAKPLEQSVALSLSDQITTLDSEKRLVPATRSSRTTTGTKSVPATGTKTIGDPAKGEVIIYNRTTLTKNFLKGTLLTSGSLKFTLDEDVAVASKSAGADYVDVPGKATAKIVAKDIGSASNLAAGSEFTLATFGKESYVAKNESALSGGTSSTITVVSTDDKKTLVEDLKTELMTKLKEQLQSDNSHAYYLLDQEVEITDEQYSAKVGGEAQSLDGTLTLTVSILEYQPHDVESLVEQEISKAIPEGYVRANLPPTISLDTSTISNSGEVVVTARLSVYVLPILNETQLKNNLKGKSRSQLAPILSSIPGFINYDLVITPKFLPPRLQSLPRNAQNITISITPSL